MTAALENVPEIALAWQKAGREVALATVIQTWGSAPRPVGAQLVIDSDAAMEGSVSGGCVEGAVITEALEVMQDLTSRVLSFGVSDDEAFAVGLACGGEIKVLVEPLASFPEGLLEDLVSARTARQPVTYEVSLETWDRRLLPDLLETGLDGALFRAAHAPPMRLVIVGAVHIAQALVPMAQMAGFDVALIDPRPVFGAEARFGGLGISDDWPDEALGILGLDSSTAVVTLTHDPKLDDPAITAALGSDVFYLGCLGSKRTHAKRVTRLQDAGFDATAIARIHAPVGLDIGARGPAEIAVSVLAEVIARMRGK